MRDLDLTTKACLRNNKMGFECDREIMDKKFQKKIKENEAKSLANEKFKEEKEFNRQRRFLYACYIFINVVVFILFFFVANKTGLVNGLIFISLFFFLDLILYVMIVFYLEIYTIRLNSNPMIIKVNKRFKHGK